MNKLVIPCLYLQYEKAVTGFGQRNLFGDGDVEALADFYSKNGADELLVFDFSSADAEHDRAIGRIKDICLASSIPVIGAGNIKCMEDVKKLIYAGCAKVVLNFSKQGNIDLLEEVSRRFGKEKMIVSISEEEEFIAHKELIETYASSVLALDLVQESIAEISAIPVILHTYESKEEALVKLFSSAAVKGISGAYVSSRDTSISEFKMCCKEKGISVRIFSDGAGGVENESLFFKTLIQKENGSIHSTDVLRNIYEIIQDGKVHPEEDFCDSQLFHEGTDSILRKLGEECAEIIIAAKNPDKEEMKYKISDFLYHLMMLMAEKDVTWDDIIIELTRR